MVGLFLCLHLYRLGFDKEQEKKNSMTLGIRTDSLLLERLKQLEGKIGDTPLFPVKHIYRKEGVSIYAKLEWQQLSGSVKARAGYNIIKQAVLEGQLSRRRGLIDASSGNTGVAYATVGKALNIPVTMCIPENVSEQKKAALLNNGAEIVYTSRFGTTDEAQLKARELAEEQPGKYFYANQYANDNNWKAHYHSTAPEIWEQTGNEITHFIAGLGTTGTFVGTSRRLKEFNPEIEVISMQPDAAMHGLEGWKHMDSAIVPGIYDEDVADRNIHVDTLVAYEVLKDFHAHEGLLISPSSAANLAGAIQLAEQIDEGVIVTTFADHGSNYPEVINELFSY
jgi:cysteine synthase B